MDKNFVNLENEKEEHSIEEVLNRIRQENDKEDVAGSLYVGVPDFSAENT